MVNIDALVEKGLVTCKLGKDATFKDMSRKGSELRRFLDYQILKFVKSDDELIARQLALAELFEHAETDDPIINHRLDEVVEIMNDRTEYLSGLRDENAYFTTLVFTANSIAMAKLKGDWTSKYKTMKTALDLYERALAMIMEDSERGRELWQVTMQMYKEAEIKFNGVKKRIKEIIETNYEAGELYSRPPKPRDKMVDQHERIFAALGKFRFVRALLREAPGCTDDDEKYYQGTLRYIKQCEAKLS